MTKTKEIEDLLRLGLHPENIADEIECHPAFARAVLNRMRNREKTGFSSYPKTLAKLRGKAAARKLGASL